MKMKPVQRRLGAVLPALAMLCATAYALTVEEAIELLEEHYLREEAAASLYALLAAGILAA